MKSSVDPADSHGQLVEIVQFLTMLGSTNRRPKRTAGIVVHLKLFLMHDVT